MSVYTNKVWTNSLGRQWIVLTSATAHPGQDSASIVFQVEKILAFGHAYPEGSWVCVGETSEDDPWRVKEAPEQILEALK